MNRKPHVTPAPLARFSTFWPHYCHLETQQVQNVAPKTYGTNPLKYKTSLREYYQKHNGIGHKSTEMRQTDYRSIRGWLNVHKLRKRCFGFERHHRTLLKTLGTRCTTQPDAAMMTGRTESDTHQTEQRTPSRRSLRTSLMRFLLSLINAPLCTNTSIGKSTTLSLLNWIGFWRGIPHRPNATDCIQILCRMRFVSAD